MGSLLLPKPSPETPIYPGGGYHGCSYNGSPMATRITTKFNPSPELKGRITKFVGQDRVDAYIASQPDPWTALYDLAKVVQTIRSRPASVPGGSTLTWNSFPLLKLCPNSPWPGCASSSHGCVQLHVPHRHVHERHSAASCCWGPVPVLHHRPAIRFNVPKLKQAHALRWNRMKAPTLILLSNGWK